jgi:hypothetical protein
MFWKSFMVGSPAKCVVEQSLRGVADLFESALTDRIHRRVIVQPGIGADEPQACDVLALGFSDFPPLLVGKRESLDRLRSRLGAVFFGLRKRGTVAVVGKR